MPPLNGGWVYVTTVIARPWHPRLPGAGVAGRAGETQMADDDDPVAKARQQGEAIAALRRDLEALARAHADLLAQMQKRPPR